MQEKREELCWTTQDGRKIRVSDLEDSHLKNIVRLIKRAGYTHSSTWFSAVNYLSSDLGGEMAQECLEQELNNMWFSDVTDAVFEEYNRRSSNAREN